MYLVDQMKSAITISIEEIFNILIINYWQIDDRLKKEKVIIQNNDKFMLLYTFPEVLSSLRMP